MCTGFVWKGFGKGGLQSWFPEKMPEGAHMSSRARAVVAKAEPIRWQRLWDNIIKKGKRVAMQQLLEEWSENI